MPQRGRISNIINIISSILILLYGIYTIRYNATAIPQWVAWILVASGILGIIGNIYVFIKKSSNR